MTKNNQDWFDKYLESPLCGSLSFQEIHIIKRDLETEQLMPGLIDCFNLNYQYLSEDEQKEMVKQYIAEFKESEWNVSIGPLSECLNGFLEEKHPEYLQDC